MYQKIMNYLMRYTDKVFQFTAGMIICLIASIFLPAWVATCIALLAGLLKEIRDKLSYGLFDWIDFVVTTSGGLFVFICQYLNDI
jgi:hypothetical protein